MLGIRYLSVQNWATDIVATLATGTAFTPLGTELADEVTIFLPSTGVSIDILRSPDNDTTKFITLEAPSGTTFPLSGSLSEISVRRNDQSNTPATIRFSWRKFRR